MYKIREATERDFSGITKLITSREELFRVYPNGTYPFTESQVKVLAQRRRELTVAIDGDEVIGFANLYDDKQKAWIFIGNVIIKPHHRGKGLGKEIVTYMLEKAFNKYNLPEVRISVFSDNIPALLLYSDFGFLPYDIEERSGSDGNRTALIHMKIAHSRR